MRKGPIVGLAAVVLAVLIAQVATAGTSSNLGDPNATASAVTTAKFKKLKRQVSELKQQVDTLAKQPGPQGAQGPVGPSTGAAGGDLTGNYPNPEIGPGKVGPTELADFSVGASAFALDIPWVRATNLANQSIPDSTDTVLAFNSERFDSGFLHDNVTNNSRLTAPGPFQHLYSITASVQFAANATGVRSVSLRKNGTTLLANDTRSATSVGVTGTTISTVTFMSPGQYVEVVVNQTSSGALDVVKSNEQSPEFALALLPSND